jgi:hypothetical protein
MAANSNADERKLKERPILFRPEMVRAIIDGRKTQTRRIVKPEHVDGTETDDDGNFLFMHSPTCGGYCDYACASSGEVFEGHIGWTPWGSNPNDRAHLWVREPWTPFFKRTATSNGCCYKADDDGVRLNPGAIKKWKPSIHMPRWASRLTLEITGVRVERLQAINWLDACAEGFEPPPGRHHVDSPQTVADRAACIAGFAHKWDQINGEGSWNANPWVWAITFRVFEKRG